MSSDSLRFPVIICLLGLIAQSTSLRIKIDQDKFNISDDLIKIPDVSEDGTPTGNIAKVDLVYKYLSSFDPVIHRLEHTIHKPFQDKLNIDDNDKENISPQVYGIISSENQIKKDQLIEPEQSEESSPPNKLEQNSSKSTPEKSEGSSSPNEQEQNPSESTTEKIEGNSTLNEHEQNPSKNIPEKPEEGSFSIEPVQPNESSSPNQPKQPEEKSEESSSSNEQEQNPSESTTEKIEGNSTLNEHEQNPSKNIPEKPEEGSLSVEPVQPNESSSPNEPKQPEEKSEGSSLPTEQEQNPSESTTEKIEGNSTLNEHEQNPSKNIPEKPDEGSFSIEPVQPYESSSPNEPKQPEEKSEGSSPPTEQEQNPSESTTEKIEGNSTPNEHGQNPSKNIPEKPEEGSLSIEPVQPNESFSSNEPKQPEEKSPSNEPKEPVENLSKNETKEPEKELKSDSKEPKEGSSPSESEESKEESSPSQPGRKHAKSAVRRNKSKTAKNAPKTNDELYKPHLMLTYNSKYLLTPSKSHETPVKYGNKSVVLYAREKVQNELKSIQHNISFVVAKPSSPDDTTVITYNGANVDEFNMINPDWYTVILIHGMHYKSEKYSSAFIKMLTEEIKKKERNLNIIAVDWHSICPNYRLVRENVEKIQFVALHVYSYLQNLADAKMINMSRVTAIGHQLGALIASHVGALTRGKMRKIVALDPSMAKFWNFPTYGYPSQNNAKEVEIISTSGNSGYTGHRNIVLGPRFGPQPGCEYEIAGVCSSFASIGYYVSGIRNPVAIQAEYCSSNTPWCDQSSYEIRKIKIFNIKGREEDEPQGFYHLEFHDISNAIN